MRNMKDWKKEEGGLMLEAFLGARGVKTKFIRTSEELVDLASEIFEVSAADRSVTNTARLIDEMTKAERAALFRKNGAKALLFVSRRAHTERPL